MESNYSVLIVDDDAGICRSRVALLRSIGYNVTTATDGIDALQHLRMEPLPTVIISDLNMRRMSGYEFLSIIRRRFPQIGTIASGAAYPACHGLPDGIIADAFHSKQLGSPAALIAAVASLCADSPQRMPSARDEVNPVWVASNGSDSDGAAFVLLCCPECLRCFSFQVLHTTEHRVQQGDCPCCSATVKCVVDFSNGAIPTELARAHDWLRAPARRITG